MNKQDRLRVIKTIIGTETITSQSDLLNKLEGKGIRCTQATLSRDLRQLHISKVTDQDGNNVYRLLKTPVRIPGSQERTGFISFVTEMAWAAGLLLVKTAPGYAAPVASSIDQHNVEEVAGTIAGDDTVLVIPKDNSSGDQIMSAVTEILT